MADHTSQRSNLPRYLWLGYVLFVIYGSLVPLKYKARSFDDAWTAFQHIPFLKLGVDSRADWISNGVLYVPVGFLTVYLLTQTYRRTPRFLALVAATFVSVALAVGVEFTQLYFPQRTVSLNDIVAECIGSVLGTLLALGKSHWFHALIESFTQDTRRLKMLALDGYAFAYVALALFPYDFFISEPELLDKINSDSWGWLIAGTTPRFLLACLQLGAEVLLVLPFGYLLAKRISPKPADYPLAVLTGLLIGVAVETAQFFMASGISQGLSVLAKVAGVCCGMMLSQRTANWSHQQMTSQLRRFTSPIAFAYALVLLGINGLLTLNWRSTADAADQLEQIHFTPFYYHYFTTEAKALFSLGVVALSYMPNAVIAWSWGRSPRLAFAVTLALCAAIEACKLFSYTTHADPTNVLIASIASWCTVHVLQQLSKKPLLTVAIQQVTDASQPAAKTAPLWLLLPLIAMGFWAARFPAFPVLVATVLVVCAAAVWFRPIWLLTIVPGALPIFDLAPWSGRFFWDEFDSLLVVVLAIGYARGPHPPNNRQTTDLALNTAIALLAVCLAISTIRGITPFQWPDANAFNSYYSPYNALRIAKGAIWAYLVFGLYKRFLKAGFAPQRLFGWGMTLGLAMTVAFIIGERVFFCRTLGLCEHLPGDWAVFSHACGGGLHRVLFGSVHTIFDSTNT